MLSSVSLPWQLALTFHVPAVWRPLMVIMIRSRCVAPLTDPVSTPLHVPVSGPCGVAAGAAAAVAPASTATITRRRRIQCIIAHGGGPQ